MNEETPKEVIDWARVHRRVEAARQATRRGSAPSPDERRRILRERAKVLAREPAALPVPVRPLEAVAFTLAHETYGIALPFVHEVRSLKTYTPLPCTPPFVLGLINVRGQIVSVIDLRRLFDLPDLGTTPSSKVIILQSAAMEVGILADAVMGVRALGEREILPGPPTLTGIREAFLKGVTADGLVLLDGERLLSSRSIVVQEHVEE